MTPEGGAAIETGMDVASALKHPGRVYSVLLARHETELARLTWLAGLGTALAAGAYSTFVIVTQASRPWHRLVDAALMGALLLLSLAMAAYVRRAQGSIFRHLQAALSAQIRELHDMATRDELTQLSNRRYFFERLQEGWARARLVKEPLAFLLIDVDGLKGINDNYGHPVGDIVLRNLAQALIGQVRASDVVARLGGDEFGILMPDTDKRGAFALARRLWQELAEHPIYQNDGVSFHLDVSIGVSGYPWGGDDVDQMLRWADADMYANKVSRKLWPALAEEEKASSIEAAPNDYL